MKDNENTEVASLIYFKPGISRERVLQWIAKLEEKGVIQGHATHEYNPEYGAPVWYIP
jgi:hypothetical protein